MEPRVVTISHPLLPKAELKLVPFGETEVRWGLDCPVGTEIASGVTDKGEAYATVLAIMSEAKALLEKKAGGPLRSQ